MFLQVVVIRLQVHFNGAPGAGASSAGVAGDRQEEAKAGDHQRRQHYLTAPPDFPVGSCFGGEVIFRPIFSEYYSQLTVCIRPGMLSTIEPAVATQ